MNIQVAPLIAACALALASASAPGVDLNTAQDAYNRKDYEAAFKEFQTLAEQGDALAMSSLGVLYDNGQGVARDYDKAIDWYRRSAEQGNQFGQFNLGTMYYMGTGAEKDMVEACKWFELATRQGNGPARIHMRLCAKYLSEEQRVEANQRMEAWLKDHNQY
jgi:uncharacterized protein